MALPQTAAVVGENLRRLRERSGLTQHETAHLVRRHGLLWDRSMVAGVEAGNRQRIGLDEVILLAVAFNVEIDEFLGGDGAIQLAKHAVLGRNVVRDVVRGGHVRDELRNLTPEARRKELFRVKELVATAEATMHPGATEADNDLARRLELPLEVVTEAAYSLWDRTMTEERNIRVSNLGEMDTDERQAHRGHITRELSQQIEAELRKRGVAYD